MPQGVQSVTINVLGKDREFRVSMKTIREIREATGISLLSTSAKDAITDKLDVLFPVLLFAGLRDHEGIDSIESLEDAIDIKEIITLAPQMFAAMGMEAKEKNEQPES